MIDDPKHSNPRAVRADRAALRPVSRGLVLSLENKPHKTVNLHRSPDPYNSSGSFDRTKNWERIGKR